MKNVIDLIVKEKTILKFVFVEFLFLLIIPFSSSWANSPIFPYLFIFAICLALYAMYILYQIFVLLSKRTYEEQQRKMIVRQQEIQNQYILAQMQCSKDLNQLRMKLQEEMKIHNIDQKEDLRKKVDELLVEYQSVLSLNYSNNKIIDIILYNKVLLMKKLHIRHVIDCQVNDDLPLSSYEIMSVLNNLLDNAIEACSFLDIKQRYIELTITVVANYLVVKVTNAIANPDICLIPGVSTKEDKKNHGIGLMVIEHTCKKNLGSFQYEIDSKNKLITCIATLSLKKEGE